MYKVRKRNECELKQAVFSLRNCTVFEIFGNGQVVRTILVYIYKVLGMGFSYKVVVNSGKMVSLSQDFTFHLKRKSKKIVLRNIFKNSTKKTPRCRGVQI